MKKISLFVVTAAAVALVLSGCSRGPGTDDMEMMPSLDGTWVFTGFSALIAVPDVTVTVGDGMNPLGTEPPYSFVGKIVVKGTLTLAEDGTDYKLTLSDEDRSIVVSSIPGAPQGSISAVVAVIRGVIETAQTGNVMITVDEDADPDTITVTGSFVSTLVTALGMQVPETGLMGCKNALCMMAP